MSNIQSARLIIDTYFANTRNGTINANKTTYLLRNINLRTLMGDMYDKYDLFNLCLKSIITGVCDSALGTTLDDLAVQIKISGLPFINATYNPDDDCNNDYAVLTTFNFKRGESVSVNYNENYLTFSKNQNVVDLEFTYESINDGVLPDTTNAFPIMCYIFDIVGVGEPKDINKIMNQRIF